MGENGPQLARRSPGSFFAGCIARLYDLLGCYLSIIMSKVLAFMKKDKIVGAICHGPIVLARTIDPQTEKSIIYDRKITSLTKRLERLAYYLSFWKLGKYYRTYPIMSRMR